MYAGICIFENGLLYHVLQARKNALMYKLYAMIRKLHACVTKSQCGPGEGAILAVIEDLYYGKDGFL